MYPKISYSKVANEDSDDVQPLPSTFYVKRQRPFTSLLLVFLCLVASNTATWFFATRVTTAVSFRDRTTYAGLSRDTIDLLDGHGPYTDANETLRDQLWLDIDVDDGMIALDDADVERWGLPVSQRFPWDTSKGIYLLQGHHNLHCARSIYISLMEYRKGLPQSRKHHHIIHCLDALRRDVICNADDIPRYTTEDPSPETGHGQPRQCRSWDALNKWAKQHNACYRYTHETSGVNYPEIQRFVWCPEGSPYRKEVDKYFVVDYDAPRGSGII